MDHERVHPDVPRLIVTVCDGVTRALPRRRVCREHFVILSNQAGTEDLPEPLLTSLCDSRAPARASLTIRDLEDQQDEPAQVGLSVQARSSWSPRAAICCPTAGQI
jgi:hypothetical protein